MRALVLLLGASSLQLGPSLAKSYEACVYDGKVSWDGPRAFTKLLKCDADDPFQRWEGLDHGIIRNQGAGTQLCLSTASHDPIRMMPCADDTTRWFYNRSNLTVAVVAAAKGTLAGKGVGACIDVMGGAGPDVDIWTCHQPGNPDAPHQQFTYDARSKSIQSPHVAGLCLSLNRTAMAPYVSAPCTWPNKPPPPPPPPSLHHYLDRDRDQDQLHQHPPIPPSEIWSGITILENATAIPNFGADTFYPAEDRHGDFFTGFDDGGILGVSVTSYSGTGRNTTNGAAIVSGGGDWRHLSVATTPSGAIREDGAPMTGRYTSANAVINGTWWTGTYGLGMTTNPNRTFQQSVEIGPFVGFRYSTDMGATWTEPAAPGGAALSVGRSLFGEKVGDAIKYQSPHVVDHGPENVRSPDGALYMVASGCLADRANENCTWISGDAVFLARATGFRAAEPGSLNDAAGVWEFWAGKSGWSKAVADAAPVLTWRGRVGAVTASWHPGIERYLMTITAPTVTPSSIPGPYDTFIVEAPALAGPWSLVTYMPRFGMQAYFVSLPSRWFGMAADEGKGKGKGTGRGNHDDADDKRDEAVLTFSANFDCKIQGCAPNILNAGYGANLLPVRFIKKQQPLLPRKHRRAASTSGSIFSVLDYGAVGDGKTLDTAAVRAAAAALRSAGGGQLLFPGGGGGATQDWAAHNRTYVTGPFNLSSNCDLVVEGGATILGSPRGRDWPLIQPLPWYGGGSDDQQGGQLMHQALIFATDASNITLRGGGTIDGNGRGWWACWSAYRAHQEKGPAAPPCGDSSSSEGSGGGGGGGGGDGGGDGTFHSRPHLLMIVRSSRVEMSGLTVKDSPNWTLHFAMVTGLAVHHNTVLNPSSAPNADGIDLDCVQEAVVEHNYFDVGDDALCVKSGIDWLGRTFGRPSKDIIFRHNVIGHGHGITIGSEMSAGVSNVTFENITMTDTACGPRMKSQRGRGGTVDGILYKDITAANVGEMLQMTLDYHPGIPPTNATATPRFQNVRFVNVHFLETTTTTTAGQEGEEGEEGRTAGGKGGNAGEFRGLPESPLVNVSLVNVTFGSDGQAKFTACEYVTNGTCDALTAPCPDCFRRIE